MLERYKLRLGDGTIVGVDYEGLSTWLVDRSAMVQAAGTGQWHPLNQFLARERSAARRAARQKAIARDPLALALSKPLPLVYPKPREAQRPVPPEEPTPRTAADPPPPAALEPPAPEPMELAPLAEPITAAGSGPLSEPTKVADLIPFAESAAFVESTDVSLAQPLGEMVFAEFPAPSELAPGDPAPSLARDEDPPIFVEPLDDGEDVGTPSALASPVDLVEPARASEPVAELTAEEAEEEEAFSALALASPLVEPPPPRAVAAAPPLPDIPWGRESAPDLPPEPARPSLQVLADDPSTARAGSTQPTRPQDDGLPIIRLKPLDDERPVRRASEPEAAEVRVAGIYEEAPEHGPLQEALLRVGARAASAYDALLTEWIVQIDRRLRSKAPVASKRLQLQAGVRAWFAGLSESVGRFRRRVVSPPPPSSKAVAPSTVAEPARPALHELLKAPPPLSQLPSLRLADIPEEEDLGDVYPTESRFQGAWRSTKRLLGWSGLVAGLLVAALTWEAWVPRTAEFGRRIATELDAIKESRDRAEQQGLALREATEKLPHLAPATIRLVLAASPTGVLDPSETFYLACEAADRGAPALTSEEAQELQTLRAELLGALRPSERARVREYDSTRARRFVFPFESGAVVELFARGAQAMPEESRDRLRELLAKAVAAGLATPVEGASRSAAR